MGGISRRGPVAGQLAWLFAALLPACSAFAQADHDTTYYLKYPDMLGVGYFEALRNNDVRIQKLDPALEDVSDFVEYKTNGRTVGGILVNYDKLFLAVGISHAQGEAGKGQSDNTNLAILLKGNRLVLEGYWRTYRGYYDNNTFGFRENLMDTVNYYVNSGMRNKNIKVKALYFLKPEKFSYNSAYYGSYRQLRSASSWIANANFYTSRVNAPAGLIPYYAREQFGDFGNLERISVRGFSGGWGWTGNLVVFKRVFINFMLTLGVEPQWRTYAFSDGAKTHPFHVSLASDLRLSAGFNSKRFFLIISSVNDRTFNESKSLSIMRNFWAVTFSIGYRFKLENKSTRWLKNNKVYRSL